MAFWQSSAYAAFWLDVARGDLATWVQLTPYVYAVFEGVHLVGVTFFFGAIFLLDLRLLGLMPQLLTEPASRFFLSIAMPAFVLVVVSGVLLFIPSADRYAASVVFFVKAAAIAAGGINALAFQAVVKRRASVWGEAAPRRRLARVTAVVSLTVWISVIVLGRGMGYERRKPPEVDLDALPVFGAVLP